MANCGGSLIARAVKPGAAVIGTMRTGKNLPWLFRSSLRRVQHIVANSHDARDTLVQNYSTAADKISVIHNSLVFPAEKPAGIGGSTRESLRMKHGVSPGTKVLLCVAMFRPEKNQRQLIEIVAGLPANAPWQLWLAGDGPARRACEDVAARKGIASRVKFLGFQPDPSPFYAAADIAVHASGSEALSNFLIEAQAHGLPAVAYNAQGINECFIPNETGWAICQNHEAEFQEALLRLLTEPDATTRRRAAAARQHARSAFDPARQVAAYLDLFHSLLHPTA
jgi:glycosyltransferase involved in cell wall biosynthesis